MVERKIKRPSALKWARVLPEEEHLLAHGVSVAAGLRQHDDPEGMPAQLDIRHLNGKTFVTPIDGPADLLPWTHAGTIDADDCRAFYRAKAAVLRTSQPEGTS